MKEMVKDKKGRDTNDEIKILAELRRNSKNNIETIAKHSGVSRQKVNRIIKRLEEQHTIWGYTTVVDEDAHGFQKFMLLLKRSNQPLEKKTADTIAMNKLEDVYDTLGVTIISSYYLHGDYDWSIIFLTKDLRTAKKFSTTITQYFPGVIAKMNLQQILFAQREHYVFNPDPKKLRGFL